MDNAEQGRVLLIDDDFTHEEILRLLIEEVEGNTLESFTYEGEENFPQIPTDKDAYIIDGFHGEWELIVNFLLNNEVKASQIVIWSAHELSKQCEKYEIKFLRKDRGGQLGVITSEIIEKRRISH